MNKDDLAALVREVQQTEHKYLLHGARHNPVTTPWMPYQPADFIGILWECLPELTGKVFLDVGCGPGTKMRIAQDLLGFDVFGVEVDEEMAAEARKVFKALRPNRIRTGDALGYSEHWYGDFDLVWLYRPFRDPFKEHDLEQKIMTALKPGAILAGSSWETDPGMLGWQPIVDDCLISPDGKSQIIRGAWQKPLGA
jgi:SAM-dependent methyltransferase